MNFQDLTQNDIEVRVGQIKEDKGCTLLLYKNARCDMNILDKTVGAENWQREHYECKGNLFCRVGIKCDGEWVYKSDCGIESNTAAEKGEASDSFKRACFNWGIGRELYTAPFIWVSAKDVQLNGKKTYDKFAVQKIKIEGKRITELIIANTSLNRVVFKFSARTGSQNTQNPPPPPPSQPTTQPKTETQALIKEINRLSKECDTVAGTEQLFYYKTVIKSLGLEKKHPSDFTVEDLTAIRDKLSEFRNGLVNTFGGADDGA